MLPLSFTQNFLHSPQLVQTLVRKSGIPSGATVLEIGPGKGIITQELATLVKESCKVVAVELDHQLAQSLQQKFAKVPLVEIVEGDILAFSLNQLPNDYVVFSNIPFNITSEILELLFTSVYGPQSAFLILQIDTLVGRSGKLNDGVTLKSLLVYPFYSIEILHIFNPSDFSPRPSVDTALFSFEKREQPLIDGKNIHLYKDFVAFVSKDRVGEGAWRKLFSGQQIEELQSKAKLVVGRGLMSQHHQGVLTAFEMFMSRNNFKHSTIRGAFQALRSEQDRKRQHDVQGNHHRTKSRT